MTNSNKFFLINLIIFFMFAVSDFEVLLGGLVLRDVLHDPLSTAGLGEDQTSEQSQCPYRVRLKFIAVNKNLSFFDSTFLTLNLNNSCDISYDI